MGLSVEYNVGFIYPTYRRHSWKLNASIVLPTCSPTWLVAKPNFGGIFDFDIKSEKLEQVNGELEDPKVWEEPKRAQELGKGKKSLEAIVHTLIKIDADLKDANEIFAMAREEEDKTH